MGAEVVDIDNADRHNTRIFSSQDAKIILARLIANPNQSMYNILTNKVPPPNYTPEQIRQDKQNLANQLDAMIDTMNAPGTPDEHRLGYNNFKGAWGYLDSQENTYFKFSNPRPEQVEHWFFYHLLAKDCNCKQDNYGQENITTRVYLHPKLDCQFTVWKDILQKLQNNPTVRKFGLQSKTPNFFRFDGDFPSVRNQDDRIIFYFGENAKAQVMAIIQEYISKNSDKFEPSHSLAMPILDTNNKPSDFAFISSDMPNNNSFNYVHADIIQSIMIDFAKKYRLPNGTTPSKGDLINQITIDKRLKLALTEFLVTEYPQKSQNMGFMENNIAFLK